MAWSTLYTILLMSHCQEWLTAKKQAASKVKLLADISKEITAYRKEHHPDEGALLNLEKAGQIPSQPINFTYLYTQKILTWFKNNAKGETPQKEQKKETPKGVKSDRKKYTAKEVAKEHFKDLILEHIQTLTDAKPGSPDWLKYYPATHTSVFNSLDEYQFQECEELAKEWNKVGPNQRKQAK